MILMIFQVDKNIQLTQQPGQQEQEETGDQEVVSLNPGHDNIIITHLLNKCVYAVLN